MVDDSIEIPECNFTCANDSPRSMFFYDMPVLTSKQRRIMNRFKRETIRDNEIYLATHPEIRACVALLLRHVLQIRPRKNVVEIASSFFAKPKVDLEIEINNYVDSLNLPPCTYTRIREPSGYTVMEEEVVQPLNRTEILVKDIINEILNKVFEETESPVVAEDNVRSVLSLILHEVFCETDAALMDKNKLARTISCVLDKYKSSKFSIRNIRTLIEKQQEDIESEESSETTKDSKSVASYHEPAALGDSLKQYLESYGKHVDYLVGPSVEEIIASKETRSRTEVNVLNYLRNQEQFEENDEEEDKSDVRPFKIATPIGETEEEEAKLGGEADHFDIVGELFEAELETDLNTGRYQDGEKLEQQQPETENVPSIKET